jgi:excisionase family DNA binding protein
LRVPPRGAIVEDLRGDVPRGAATMKVKHAAEKLEISVGTVYSLIRTKRLKCARHGLGRGTIRITDEHLAAYTRGAEVDAVEPLK